MLFGGLGLGEFGEAGLDCVEVGELSGGVVGLGVLDDTGFVDDEGGALWHASHDEVFVREEGGVGDVVCGSDVVIVIAEEFEGDAFFFGPGLLSEGIVTADSDDGGVEFFVFVDALGDLAELGGADAGEGHRDEEEEEVGGAEVFGEFEELGASGSEGREGEVRGGGADGECHGRWWGLNCGV